MRRRQVLLGAAGVAVGAAALPPAARAAERSVAPNLVADLAAAERDFVRWLSVSDPRTPVRAAAEAAVTGAATAFLASGYATAVTQAAQVRASNLAFANRMATGHPAQSFPWVDAEARRAAAGTDDELAAFAGTGYSAALAKDDARIPYDDGAALVTEADHDAVYGVRFLDQGRTASERAAAVRTDADAAEFLRYGWISAARIDVDEFRAQYVADEWLRWQHARSETVRAVTVDRAAREGTADAYSALRAWDSVRTLFARQPAAWTERERYARDRSEQWLRISYQTADATSPLWAGLTVEAPAVRSRWLAERTGAARQSVWWSELNQYARVAYQEWLDYT
ncbi:hypothetical protein [Paractinoplanes maris]|uniref:hypothetical protein n=1 Tax=Paractinoplanes maris TaxID=1734446 RepID=UPI0020217EEB|nr:hypothetical protein [Actinoplanes maris]